MTPTPLHRQAEDARKALGARAALVPSTSAQPIIDAVGQAGRRSVNQKPSGLEFFLDDGCFRNKFEVASDLAAQSGRTIDDELRDLMGDYCDLRIQFEEYAGGGSRHFHYAALNVGNLGAPGYGRYCVVDGRALDDEDANSVWVVEDSLTGTRFRDEDGALVEKAVSDWIAPRDACGALAVIKLGNSPHTSPLADRICSENDYIEALSLVSLSVEDVDEIRVDATDDDAIQKRALDLLLGGPDPAEELALDLEVRLRQRAKDLGITWKRWEQS